MGSMPEVAHPGPILDPYCGTVMGRGPHVSAVSAQIYTEYEQREAERSMTCLERELSMPFFISDRDDSKNVCYHMFARGMNLLLRLTFTYSGFLEHSLSGGKRCKLIRFAALASVGPSN